MYPISNANYQYGLMTARLHDYINIRLVKNNVTYKTILQVVTEATQNIKLITSFGHCSGILIS